MILDQLYLIDKLALHTIEYFEKCMNSHIKHGDYLWNSDDSIDLRYIVLISMCWIHLKARMTYVRQCKVVHIGDPYNFIGSTNFTNLDSVLEISEEYYNHYNSSSSTLSWKQHLEDLKGVYLKLKAGENCFYTSYNGMNVGFTFDVDYFKQECLKLDPNINFSNINI